MLRDDRPLGLLIPVQSKKYHTNLSDCWLGQFREVDLYTLRNCPNDGETPALLGCLRLDAHSSPGLGVTLQGSCES